jgi:hypothetical protein
VHIETVAVVYLKYYDSLECCEKCSVLRDKSLELCIAGDEENVFCQKLWEAWEQSNW